MTQVFIDEAHHTCSTAACLDEIIAHKAPGVHLVLRGLPLCCICTCTDHGTRNTSMQELKKCFAAACAASLLACLLIVILLWWPEGTMLVCSDFSQAVSLLQCICLSPFCLISVLLAERGLCRRPPCARSHRSPAHRGRVHACQCCVACDDCFGSGCAQQCKSRGSKSTIQNQWAARNHLHDGVPDPTISLSQSPAAPSTPHD